MSILANKLKKIFFITLWVALGSFVFQLIAIPLKFRFPVGSFSFVLLAMSSRYVVLYLISKYCLILNKDEYTSTGTIFMLSCMGVMLIIGLLELVFLLPY